GRSVRILSCRTRPTSSGSILLRGPSNRIPSRFRSHFPIRWNTSAASNPNSLHAPRLHSHSASHLPLRIMVDRETHVTRVITGSGPQRKNPVVDYQIVSGCLLHPSYGMERGIRALCGIESSKERRIHALKED